jgi:hypothetical protein
MITMPSRSTAWRASEEVRELPDAGLPEQLLQPSNSLDSKSARPLGAVENTKLVAFGVGQDIPVDLLITSPQQRRAEWQ